MSSKADIGMTKGRVGLGPDADTPIYTHKKNSDRSGQASLISGLHFAHERHNLALGCG
jgi:hypothetical protein